MEDDTLTCIPDNNPPAAPVADAGEHYWALLYLIHPKDTPSRVVSVSVYESVWSTERAALAHLPANNYRLMAANGKVFIVTLFVQRVNKQSMMRRFPRGIHLDERTHECWDRHVMTALRPFFKKQIDNLINKN